MAVENNNNSEAKKEESIDNLISEEEKDGKTCITVNEEECKKKAKEFVEKLSKNIIPKDAKEAKLFINNMELFKISEFYCKADKLVAGKKIESEKVDEAKRKVAPKGPSIDFKNLLDLIAYGGLFAIFALILVSVGCVVDCQDAAYAATSILNSNFMIVLTSTVIAPIITRVMKEKFDIDIDASQIDMLMKDGVKTVTKYQKLADQLRDENGKIPPQYRSKLKDMAFVSMRETFDVKNYKGLIASTAGQVIDKAIESAVNQNKLDKKPIEKNQIEELIKQGIDAYTQIVEWKDLDPQVKDAFVEGHIRRLLKNVGINGWAKTSLENMFDVEVGKRLVQAARLDMENVTPILEKRGKYLKYSSTVIDTLLKK